MQSLVVRYSMVNYALSRVRILVRYPFCPRLPSSVHLHKIGEARKERKREIKEQIGAHGQWAALSPQSSSPPAAHSFPLHPLAPLIVPSPLPPSLLPIPPTFPAPPAC